MVLGDNGDVLGKGVHDQGTCVFGILRIGVGDEGDEPGKEETNDGLVGDGGLGLHKERANAVGCDFRSLQGRPVSNNQLLANLRGIQEAYHAIREAIHQLLEEFSHNGIVSREVVLPAREQDGAGQ